jgi:two-component sensor histidine kinase
MIAGGQFPSLGQRSDHADTPRVGDGFLRVDADGIVVYASPNALSVYRRLGLSGDLAGSSLADLTRQLVPPRDRPDEETLSAVLGGRAYRDTEIESRPVSLIVRSIPLRPQGRHIGALVLVRDVTDLRRRDRELVTKDATIREIHHRVKNNLQTVAALLRLQSRRIGEPAAKAALDEAVRRVGSIALVHETLSLQAVEERVAFDEIADRLGVMVTEVSAVGMPVRMRRTGSFGALPSVMATPLAMVITELLQNAVEHGYAGVAAVEVGRIDLLVSRQIGRLRLSVEDHGRGLPEGFDLERSTNLGLSIVKTLVESELKGTLKLTRRADGHGTQVAIDVPLAD